MAPPAQQAARERLHALMRGRWPTAAADACARRAGRCPPAWLIAPALTGPDQSAARAVQTPAWQLHAGPPFRPPGHRAAQRRGARSRAGRSRGAAGPRAEARRRRHLHGRGPGRTHGQGPLRPGRFRRNRIPASNMKLLTAVAALRALGPERALQHHGVASARVRLAGPGGADRAAGTSCSARANPPRTRCWAMPGSPPLPPTAASLRKDGVTGQVKVLVDDSLFTGPSPQPGLEPGDVAAGEMAPLFPLALNSGTVRSRRDHRAAPAGLRPCRRARLSRPGSGRPARPRD